MTRRRRRKSRGGQLRGARAVATGAVLYTAVRAMFVGAQHASRQAAAGESNTTRPRPSRAPAREDRPEPSLTLPNQRWPRIAAERR